MRSLVAQMELALEECEATASEDEVLVVLAAAKANVTPFERKRLAQTECLHRADAYVISKLRAVG